MSGGRMTEQDWFEVDVDCAAERGAHAHRLRVGSAPLGGLLLRARGPAKVGPRWLEYTCPLTGETRLASCSPPAGFDWPFTVLSVDLAE
jgi:hypothetical protein